MTFLGLAVVIVMAYTLVPAVSKLYKDLGASLPFATRFMMQLSDHVDREALRHPTCRLFLFYILMKNWGKITKKPTSCRRSLSTRLQSVDIVRMSSAARSASAVWHCSWSLESASARPYRSPRRVRRTSITRTFFANIKEHITDGTSMQESFLMESHWLGKDGRTICGIMDIAGETGSATEMLDEIADDYEDELDSIANQIDKVMEPITILFLGGLVGFLVYAIYSPIFGLSEVMLGDGKDKKPPKTAHP